MTMMKIGDDWMEIREGHAEPWDPNCPVCAEMKRREQRKNDTRAVALLAGIGAGVGAVWKLLTRKGKDPK